MEINESLLRIEKTIASISKLGEILQPPSFDHKKPIRLYKISKNDDEQGEDEDEDEGTQF